MSNHESWGKHRDVLTGEHPFGDAGQFIILVLFMAVWITDSFIYNYSTFLNGYVPAAVHLVLAAIFVIIAVYLALAGLNIVFNGIRDKPQVIRNGVFRISRHPIYFSEILLYLGLLFYSISLASAVIWVIAIIFVRYISRHEEKLLLERFGEEYRQYMDEVPMLLPRLRKRQ